MRNRLFRASDSYRTSGNVGLNAAPAQDEGFFDSLIEELARLLDADGAWIGKMRTGGAPRLQTLAVYSDGRSAENFEYDLVDTPAETALARSGVYLHSSGVQELFPADPVLRRFNADSFAGVPVFDRENEPIGMIIVVSCNSFRDTRLAASLLRVFAARASAELERVKAAESLRTSEARLRLIFENTPDAHLLLTLDGKLLEANRTAENLTGYRREELIGRNVLLPGILPEEDLRRAASKMALRAAGAPPSQDEYTIIHRNGSRIAVETYSQVTSMDGVQVMLLSMRDITLRKAAQHERQRRLDLVRELQAAAFRLAMHEVVANGDLNQVAALITETVCRVTRAPAVSVWLFAADDEIRCLDRFDGRMARHSTLKNMRSQALARHRFALELARSVESPAASVSPSGNGTPSGIPDSHALASLDSGIRIRGSIAGFLRVEQVSASIQQAEEAQFVAGVSDLLAQALINEERAGVEASLRMSEARLNRTQRLASLGSWERILATDAMEWSDEVFRIYGIARKDFVPARQFFLDRVCREDIAKIDAAFNELLLTGEPCQVTFRIIRPDGSLRHVREQAELESNAAGQPVRLIGSVQDITDFKHMEENFQTAQRLEGLGRLAGGIARSFDNLLMVVNGYSSLIARSPSNQAVVRNGMEVIRKAGEDASQMIQQLLAFSQPHATETVVLDLNAIVREFDRMLRPLLGAGIDVVSLLEPELGRVEASPAQLNQILLNLAVNARDAMPKGGRLTIQTENAGANGPGASVVLSIMDTGEGMDEATRAQVLEPFFTTRQATGAKGLGMSTVYGIVQQCGGKIHVDSRPGAGTTARIFLPRVHENSALQEDPLAEDSIRGNETVLVVEDQPEVRTLTCSVLEGLGYRILNAPNADSAIRLSSGFREPIHLLLTDVMMPGMPGDELADRLRELRPSIKVLFMSGYAVNTAIQRRDATQGAAFIRKPFEPFALAARIRELLGSPATAVTILIAGGNEGSRGMLRRVLESAGFRVLEAVTFSEAKSHLRKGSVELLLSDPTGNVVFDAENHLPELRREFPGLEVILLGSEDESKASEFGVDTVLARPIQPDVLISAVRELLSRKIQPEHV